MNVHAFYRGVARVLLVALIGSSVLSPVALLRAEDAGGESDGAAVTESAEERGEPETSATEEDSESSSSEGDVETQEAEESEGPQEETTDVVEEGENGGEIEESESVENEESAAGAETTAPSSASTTTTSATSSEDLSEAATAPSSATSTDTGGGALELTGSSTPASATSTAAEGIATSTASSTQPGPTIVSGRAIALANILNLVNTNFVNSKGIILFSNFFEAIKNSIDFRNYFNAASSTCGGPCTGGDDVTIRMENNAHIDNDIYIEATSGGNAATSTGSAAIKTGDAYAGLNLINIANTNFVDSEYLLVTLNAFNDVEGDLVFPSLSNFFESMARGVSSLSTLSIQNQASVENNVDVSADSGNNSAQADGGSQITTGDAHATTNVFNQINTTLAGDRAISILFRVHGTWAGEVFGAPQDLLWTGNGDDGIFLLERSESSTGVGGEVDVTASSTALIKNDVSVVALTGDNRIDTADTALISTGDAYAGANVVNIANGNVVGRNWILAVINIFGNFTGNIAFGRPDLWVGEQIDVPGKIENGSELTYKFTVINNGDSEANGVVLTDAYDSAHIEIIESSAAYTQEGGELLWNLPALGAGDGVEITYRARIKDADPGMEIANTVSVESHETDNNLEDNTDTASVVLDSPTIHRSLKERRELPRTGGVHPEVLTVSRTEGFASVEPGTVVTQRLIIKNPGRKATLPVVLYDKLYDPSGNLIKEEPWNLGVILPHEEITISYDVVFDDDALPGLYTLSTSIEAGAEISLFEKNGMIYLAGLPETPALPLVVEVAAEEIAEDLAPGILDVFTPPTAYAASEDLTAGAANAGVTLFEASGVLLLGLLFGFPYLAPALYARVRTRFLEVID